ncbi:MAG: formate dehydrogenase accessory sulfurtransferase FdhD [Nocardioidaceae bacterium]
MSVSKRPGPTSRRRVVEVVRDEPRRRPDTVVTEEPLEIRLGWPGQPVSRVAVVMRTPGADFELAAGFLLTEGVLATGQRPRSIGYCVDPELTADQTYNVVTVELGEPPQHSPAERFTSVSSACGVCGTQSLDDVFPQSGTPLGIDETLDGALVAGLPDALREAQPVFSRTGSIHAAGVFDFAGRLVVAREDVGRHNAVDKVLGARLLGATSYDERSVLCVSGRVGFDIISKAAVGRFGVVVAVGGPSSLAVQLAERAGVTVCGFARGKRYVVYTHPERIAELGTT